MLAEIRGITNTDSLKPVLFVAAVVMAAVVALYAFPRGPRVMAVEFNGTWASAVLEGNEIVPNLLQIATPPREPGDNMRFWADDLTCWSSSETALAPKGWRERLTARQAREFEDLYCTALQRTNYNWDLVDCAWVRGDGLDCTGRWDKADDETKRRWSDDVAEETERRLHEWDEPRR